MTISLLHASDIDLWSNEVLADPYPFWAEFREAACLVIQNQLLGRVAPQGDNN